MLYGPMFLSCSFCLRLFCKFKRRYSKIHLGECASAQRPPSILLIYVFFFFLFFYVDFCCCCCCCCRWSKRSIAPRFDKKLELKQMCSWSIDVRINRPNMLFYLHFIDLLSSFHVKFQLIGDFFRATNWLQLY